MSWVFLLLAYIALIGVAVALIAQSHNEPDDDL